MFCSGGAPEDLADEVIEGLITPCLLPIIPTGRSRQVLGVFFLDDWRFLVSAGSNHQGN